MDPSCALRSKPKKLVIKGENKAFCGTLGIGPQATLYTQCATGLADISARWGSRASPFTLA